MKHTRWLVAVALAVVIGALIVACDNTGPGYWHSDTTVVHHYHHGVPRTTSRYRVPAHRPAAPRVPSFSKGRR
ncbi:hypothetical protein [Streptomyces lydicus]|uniref:hypothetical protein n=1 Tax=Streptomyces lydicus TaxID=47763 RepID=UPI0037AADADD